MECQEHLPSDEDLDAEDEWFYQSVKRYVHLCMYELPIQVEAFGISPDGHHICAVGMRQHSDPILEISVLKIPDKVLTTNSTLEGYLNGRDFSVQAGVRKPITENEQDELKIKSISFVSNDIIAVCMSSGVTTWALSPHTDLLEFVQSFPFPRTKGMLVLNENQLALSSRSEIAILDVKKGDALEKAATEFKAIEDVAQKDGFVYVAHELGTKVSVYNPLKDKDDIEDHQVPSPASNISQAQLCEEDPLYLCTLDSVGKKLSICHVTNGSNVSVSCDCSRLFQWTKLNRLITLCEDSNHICIWSFDGQQDLRKAFVHDGHKSHVKHVAQHSVIENMFLSADGRENFHLWLYNEKYGSISE